MNYERATSRATHLVLALGLGSCTAEGATSLADAAMRDARSEPVDARASTDGPRVDAPSETRDSVRAFISGHSLIWDLDGQLVPLSRRNDADRFLFTERVAGGSTIAYRANDADLGELAHPTALPLYDALLIVERYHLVQTLIDADTVGNLARFHSKLLEGNPAGTTYYYHSWEDLPQRSDPELWVRFHREAVAVHECIAAQVSREHMKNIPAAGALAELVDVTTRSGIPGMSSGTTEERLGEIFGDTVHVNEYAWYFLSLVVYPFLYGESAVGLPYHPSFGRDEATASMVADALQALAAQYVQAYAARPAAPSPATCAQHMVDSFCALYDQMRPEDGGTFSGRSCAATFSDPGVSPFR
jgi:hypothetical protein